MHDDTSGAYYAEENATFGDRLAAAREAAGLEQKELARRVGVKPSTLRNWENDVAEPRANRLTILSGVLGVSFRWLLTGEGDGVSPPDEVEIPQDMSAVLAEMRNLRTQATRISSRMGILEKRLRQILREGE